jgi:hypothetical protein
MSDKTVETIAAENKATREQRIALKARLKRIEAALQDCANIAMTKALNTVSSILSHVLFDY